MTIQHLTPVSAPDALAPSDLLSGAPERRVAELLTFALAAERGIGNDSASLAGLRQSAEAELEAESLRRLHNQVERIRHQAVLEHLGPMRRGPGFWRLVAASVLGGGLVALAVLWARGEIAVDSAWLAGVQDAIAALRAAAARLWAQVAG